MCSKKPSVLKHPYNTPYPPSHSSLPPSLSPSLPPSLATSLTPTCSPLPHSHTPPASSLLHMHPDSPNLQSPSRCQHKQSRTLHCQSILQAHRTPRECGSGSAPRGLGVKRRKRKRGREQENEVGARKRKRQRGRGRGRGGEKEVVAHKGECEHPTVHWCFEKGHSINRQL